MGFAKSAGSIMRRLFILRFSIAARGILKSFQPSDQRFVTARQISMFFSEPQQLAAHLFKRQRLVRQQFLQALKPSMFILLQIATYILWMSSATGTNLPPLTTSSKTPSVPT